MNDVLVLIRRADAIELVPSRALRRAMAVLVFALLTALGAFVSVPLPGTPVPVSLQTLFVSVSGVLLGARLGALAQVAYLAAGIAGLPVFTGGGAGPGHLLGPTGGYLIAFPAAAYVTGWLAPRAGRSRALLGVAIAIGTLVVFAGGVAQLALLLGDLSEALRLGLVPFLAGDAVKILLALLIALPLRDRTLGQL
ncbi:MAG: biotin transporter BioY [Longimicrobiales bacterium]